jgi:hypothetical protein
MPEAEPVVALLTELVAWTKFANRAAFVATLTAVLKDERHLRAYELSDGARGQVDVGRLAGLSQPSISALWTRWRRLGLVTLVDGHAKHLLRPSDLGIDVPSLAASATDRPNTNE